MKHGQDTSQVEHKKNRFFDNKYRGALLFVVLNFVISNLAVGLPALIMGDAGKEPLPVSAMSIILAVIYIIWFHRLFRNEFDGFLQWASRGMLLVLPCLLIVGTNCLELTGVIEAKGLETVTPVGIALVMALAPGLSEEVVYRGIPGANWQRVSNTKKDILPNVFFTAIIFGVAHIPNVFLGATISVTVYQVIYCVCLGIVFEAIYLRCGSLLPTIIMHTLIDFIALLAMDVSQFGVVSGDLAFDLSFALTSIACMLLMIWGLNLVRPAKRDEIVALWDKKWHKTQ